MSIRNWNEFCDSVDEALMPLARIKGFECSLSNAVVIYPFILIYLYAYCQVRKRLVDVMEKVKEVCEHNHASGVNYRLASEQWGGCNKRHVKRYYIVVDMDEVNVAVDDVEQQNTAD
mmetsp:Transcript_28673/g.51825  ORF Transcript_28673/g.51825 Transcript_28673/m.51825 type:complete len:117 (+) Transcript_28673:96-446(+)